MPNPILWKRITKLSLPKMSYSRRLIFSSGFVLLILFSILFRDFQEPPCTQKVVGPFGTSFLINCDSAQFMQDSQSPDRILSGISSYQDRPLYALTARTLSFPLRLFIPDYRVFKNSDGEEIHFFFSNLLGFYFLNILILFATLMLFLKYVRNKNINSVFFILSSLSTLFLNDVVKGFTWTPHTQIFSILLVAFILYSSTLFQNNLTRSQIFVWYFFVFILFFFYAIFAIALVAPILARPKKYFLPTFLTISGWASYPAVISIFGGNYRNAAAEDFDQFVWILEVENLNDIWLRISNFPGVMSQIHLIIFLILVFLFVFFVPRKKIVSIVMSNRILLTYNLGYFFFLLLMGFYAERLTIGMLILLNLSLLSILFQTLKPIYFKYLSILLFIILTVDFFIFQGNLS